MESNLSYVAAWKCKGVLSEDNASLLMLSLANIAEDMGVVITMREITDTTVLIAFNTKPTHAPHYVIQKFKNRTARLIKDNSFPDGVWNREYKVCSVGDADFDEFL